MNKGVIVLGVLSLNLALAAPKKLAEFTNHEVSIRYAVGAVGGPAETLEAAKPFSPVKYDSGIYVEKKTKMTTRLNDKLNALYREVENYMANNDCTLTGQIVRTKVFVASGFVRKEKISPPYLGPGITIDSTSVYVTALPYQLEWDKSKWKRLCKKY